MQIQLCEFCLKSGMLCTNCQKKVKSGVVNAQYIETAKKLLEMENQYHILQKIRLNDVIDTGGFLVLVVGKGDGARLNLEPKLKRKIKNIFNKRVLIIESGVKDRKFLEDLFESQHIVTINIIWLPDGSTETRVVLQGRGTKKLSKKRLKALSNVAKKVRNMDLRIEYAF